MRRCSFNDPLYHYLNGVIVAGGEIEVPVNSFYETKDGKWMCFNGAYSHLRNCRLRTTLTPPTTWTLIAAGVSKRHRSGN